MGLQGEHMKTAWLFLGVLILFAMVAACSTPGSSDIIAGDWSGIWNETYRGFGDFTANVSLTRNDTTIGGSAVTPVNGYVYTVVGTLTGTSVAGVLTLNTNPTYQITVAGTVSGDTMTGTWEDNDTPQMGGAFTMTR